ncbi:hypothetical protein [Nitrosopumilus maritimus]|uniref:Uncharacterized protein n=1 Tax=Nitrosopumilus maritimus (strain SCM1) TaxID=436308 RepID=A9A2I5_NITMS|nr:hypothetical protein [Nitrosopumilus maritimus]ABX13224.1 hypothetical protein Nmar_1328 [Nitrosopumilus maritimus SCM1]
MNSIRLFSISSVTAIFLLLSLSVFVPVLGEIAPPNKQMKLGVLAEDVICKEGLQLMIRSSGNAICVKDSSTTRLADSGSAIVVPNNPIPLIEKQTEESENTVQDEITQKAEKTIVIEPTNVGYFPGDTIDFSGKARGNQNLEITLIDPNEKEVFTEVFELDSSGNVSFQIVTETFFVEGRYFLIAEQSDDSEITPVTIGHNSNDIQLVVDDFYNKLDSELLIEMYSDPLSTVELAVYDYAEHEKFRSDITVNSNGYAETTIDLSGYKSGVYSAVLTHGTEDVDVDFAVGLKTGSTLPITLSVTKEHYVPNERVLIFGTASSNSAVTLDVINPDGDLVHEIESYSDASGKISTMFNLPTSAATGEWKIATTGRSIVNEATFHVTGNDPPLSFEIDKVEPYETGDVLTLVGSGVDTVSKIAISITSGEVIEKFEVFATEDGDFSLSWSIPEDLESGTHTITVDDNITTVTKNFEVINPLYEKSYFTSP